MTPEGSKRTLRTVAAFEASKGILVVLVGIGLFEVLHGRAQQVALDVVRHLHLNPASGYPKVFVNVVGEAGRQGVGLIAAGAAMYAMLRFVEAFGLWKLKPWGRWFGIASGAMYIPFELWELARRVTSIGLSILAINVVVVVVLFIARTQDGDAVLPE